MKQEDGDLVGFLHDFTGGLASSLNLQTFVILQITRQRLTKSTRITASFKTHGKSYHILLSKFMDNGAPFDTSGAHIAHSQWQVYLIN
jgi:hypothetical protein